MQNDLAFDMKNMFQNKWIDLLWERELKEYMTSEQGGFGQSLQYQHVLSN